MTAGVHQGEDRRRLERRGRAEKFVDALRWRLGQRPNWHVALGEVNWRDVDLSRGVAVPNPPGGYLADPFVAERAGQAALFAEEYSWSARRGAIAAYRLNGMRAERVGLVLAEPFHLSFPFVFAHAGQLWMAPECSEAGGLRLYRCLEFPDRWTLEHVALADECLADPLLFPHGGRWWLLANLADAGGAFSGRLCAWHADDPLGAWTPHAANPIVLDRQRGRNGGLLWADGVPHRVGQRQGADVYGRGLGIYRIEMLDPDSYAETPVRQIAPDFLPRIRAAHHMSHAAGITAWDYSRWGWVG